MKKTVLFLILVLYLNSSVFAQCELPLISNFECSDPAVGSFPSTLTIVDNFDKSGINSSEKIGKYEDDGTEGFDAIIFDYGAAIDLSENNLLKLKFYTSKEVQLLIKLEGGTTQRELYSNFVVNNELNTWVEFVFDFSAYSDNSSGGDGNTKLVIFVNPGVTNGNNPDTYYFDDIKWESSATASTMDNVLNKSIVFPSIFTKFLNVKSNDLIKEIHLFNINGKSVYTKSKIDNTEDSINLSQLKRGYYFVKIVTNKSILNSKVFKQ